MNQSNKGCEPEWKSRMQKQKVGFLIVGIGLFSLSLYLWLGDQGSPSDDHDNDWIHEKYGISLPDADYYVHVRMSSELDSESRRILVESGALRLGIEERLTLAARAPFVLSESGALGDSVVLAGNFQGTGGTDVPELVVPRCCIHPDSTPFDSDRLELKIGDRFRVHQCKQAVDLESVSDSPRSVLHPPMTSQRKGESRGQFLKRLSEWNGVATGHGERPSAIADAPALLILGSINSQSKSGTIHELIDRAMVIEETRSSWSPMRGATDTPIVGIDIYLNTEREQVIEAWSIENPGRSLELLCDGWILERSMVIGGMRSLKMLRFHHDSSSPPGRVIVSLLHSMGLIDIEILR
jgi:hypothetical protein